MSNFKIAQAFENKKPFICYFMAGDTTIENSKKYILSAVKAGAGIIEIGIPFSDPIAEGEVIQRSSKRALDNGTKLTDVFELANSLKSEVNIPILFMTYINPVFVYGYEKFCKKCVEIGVSGLIIPDMPFEEQLEINDIANKYKIDIITLVAPTSNDRIQKIAKNSKGFIYLVSSLGVTGMRTEVNKNLAQVVKDIKKVTTTPVAVGFGVSTPIQAKEYSKYSDGVIVGSAITRIIEENTDSELCSKKIEQFVSEMVKAIN